MIIIPAIDLQNGRCVRLLRGEFDQETVYGDDPAEVARQWRDAGASLVHVVDLDGARQGHPVQMDVIRKVAAVMPVQVGGGLRTLADVERILEIADRAVLGTAALDEYLITALTSTVADRLVVALDTRGGRVAVRGWTEESNHTLLDFARELMDRGVRRFLHTDVERDGTLTSPNYESLGALIALGVPIIASGGVSCLQDLQRLREIGAEAAIVGRALYEGTVDLREAIAHAG